MVDRLIDHENRIQADSETHRSLINHGADPNKEHIIDFFFVGKSVYLAELGLKLNEQKYTIVKQAINEELHVQMPLKLIAMKSHLITESLESVAKKHNVKFDGWGTVAIR